MGTIAHAGPVLSKTSGTNFATTRPPHYVLSPQSFAISLFFALQRFDKHILVTIVVINSMSENGIFCIAEALR